MKYFAFIFSFALLTACSDKKPAPVLSEKEGKATAVSKNKRADLTIIPGESIGKITLEQNAETLKDLGKPDLSDSAMGKSWLTWYNKNTTAENGKSELNIYTTYKNSDLTEKVIRQIRITSPDFKSVDGIHTGKAFTEIKSVYPNLKYSGKFSDPGSKNEIEVYDDEVSGVAFEIENDGNRRNCVAIIIHSKGKNVMQEYVYLHPEFVRG